MRVRELMPTRPAGQKLVGTAAVGLIWAGAVQESAGAHYVYDRAVRAKVHKDCLEVRSEISHGDGGGFTSSIADHKTTFGWSDCALLYGAVTGSLAARWTVYKVQSDGSWGYCTGGSWKYGPDIPRYHTVNDHNFGQLTPCGSGYYSTFAYGSHRNYEDGKWYGHGRAVYSGYHNLPTGGGGK